VAHGAIHLYGLAVGVSKYGKKAGVNDLDFAYLDALHLTRAFKLQKGWLFDEVHWREPLTDEAATRKAILTALRELANDVVQDSKKLKLVIVHLSGHAMRETGSHFVFLPSDFDKHEDAWTWLTWEDLAIQLEKMRCPVLLVLDTCHSGQAVLQAAGAKAPIRDEDVQNAIRDFSELHQGLMLLAAAKADKLGFEGPGVKHGLLTQAILEGIAGKAADRNPVISLGDLTKYVSKRVPELSKTEKGTKGQDYRAVQPARHQSVSNPHRVDRCGAAVTLDRFHDFCASLSLWLVLRPQTCGRGAASSALLFLIQE
jgi:hypothetical protein